MNWKVPALIVGGTYAVLFLIIALAKGPLLP